MTVSRHKWAPFEWARHAAGLLSLKCPHGGYRRVPYGHGGELGIEGFCPEARIGWKGKAVDEPVDTQARRAGARFVAHARTLASSWDSTLRFLRTARCAGFPSLAESDSLARHEHRWAARLVRSQI